MPSINLYLSRQHNGDYMLTAARPRRCEVKGAGYSDLYVAPGDPVGVRHFCPLLAEIAGAELAPLESVRVRVTIERE